MDDAVRQAQIDDFLKERRRYELRGLTNRVAQVDEQLAALGHVEKKSAPVEDAGGSSARRQSGHRG